MVRLILALALLASPAVAGCFGPPMPKRVQFEGGPVVDILSHTAQDLTYRSLMPDGAPTVLTMRHGLFMLTAANHGTQFSYTWVTPLPEPSALVPGFHGIFKADMVVEHASRSFFQSEITVLRRDTLQVQGCDYPVLVIRRQDRADGREVADLTLWLSQRLNFALRTEVTGGATFQVKTME